MPASLTSASGPPLPPSPQASGDGFVAAGRALQDAQAQVSRKFAGQPHLDYLLEAAAAGLVQGTGAGLQKVRTCWD